MLRVKGDIWHNRGQDYVVVTTNQGWNSSGEAVMGAGLALQARQRYPELPVWYGRLCQERRSELGVTVYESAKLIFFPSKALDEDRPYLSWKQDSSVSLITRGLEQLIVLKLEGHVRVPMIGCANGKLDPATILPLLEQYLTDSRFTLYTI